LEKYHDIYDLNNMDLAEAMLGYSESEFEDAESLKVLKTLAARFQTTRKAFLCSLLALEAHGDKTDFLRWSTAIDEIQGVVAVTVAVDERLRRSLSEEESMLTVISRCAFSKLDRLRYTRNTKTAFNPRTRKMASPAAKAQFLILWYPRSPGQTPCSTRGIGQKP
jgi:hypothetical protein